MSLPLVSVVTPFRDRFVFLRETLESVKSQTYQNLEIILVNDCSETDPAELLKEYVSELDIRLLTNQESLGPGLARQRGLEAAKGEYVLYLDSDDVLHPEMLEKCVRYMENNPESGMCYVTSLEFSETAQLKRPESLPIRKRSGQWIGKDIIREMLTVRRVWDTSACLWRKKTVEHFFSWTPLQGYEDYAYDSNLDLLGVPVGWVGEKLCYYRQPAGKEEILDRTKLYQTKIGMILYVSNWIYDSRVLSPQQKRKYLRLCLRSVVRLRLSLKHQGAQRPPVIRNFFLRALTENPLFGNRIALRVLNRILRLER